MTGSAILDDLRARGLLHDSTDLDALAARMDEGPITLYCGFDPTAPSLQAGNLLVMVLLRRFQLAGHQPIALAGGATGMIGDPGGRSEERNLLDAETLTANLVGIKAQLERFLDFSDGPCQARLVDNRDWTEPVSVLEFLRDVGKHMTVNQMLAKESVRARVESEAGISFTEFSYMLLQAFDFWWLHEELGCELQVGGSDQWGNITAGVELIRKRSGAGVHALTVPLLTDAQGRKLGKTASGTVWLDAGRTSPYELYQYWVNLDDAAVERILLHLTFLSVDEVAAVMDEHARAPEDRVAQRRLAAEVVEMVHGRAAADEAVQASTGFTTAAAELDEGTLEGLAREIPTTSLAREELVGAELVDLLVLTGLASSKSDARRTITGGGAYLNDAVVGEGRTVGADDVLHGRFVMLRKGKRNRHLLVLG